MEEDRELEAIRQKKLAEMTKRKDVESDSSSPSFPVEVTDETFDQIVMTDSLVVVDCWAAWCAPCRMLSPIIEDLAKDYAGKMLFGKLNVDQNPKVSMEHQIMSIPTLLIFKKGQLIDRITGAMPRRILEPKLTQYL